jgi:sRNA-binding regulator protein Hfq
MTDSIRTEKQFFAALIANGGEADCFLNHGTKIHGRIISEDEHCILLRGGAESRFAGTSLIMKNAIATVMPTNRGGSNGITANNRPD